jgi:signal transduction histidine kinase
MKSRISYTEMQNLSQRAWIPWASIALLALLCGVLGLLQYRSIGAIAAAERSRLQEELHSRLAAFSRSFNNEISRAVYELVPSPDAIQREGAAAYEAHYARWKSMHGGLLRRIAISVPRDGELVFRELDLKTGRLAAIAAAPETLAPETSGETSGNALMFRIGRFDPGNRGPGRDSRPQERQLQERRAPEAQLSVELNPDYLRDEVLPEMLTAYLGEVGHRDYDVSVIDARNLNNVIYSSAISGHGEVSLTNADDSVGLLDMHPGWGGRGPEIGHGPPEPGGRTFHPDPHPADLFRDPPPFSGPPGRWRLLARHQAGSLDALVAQTQRRNVATTLGVMLLILVTSAMLVRFSRQYQRLAELQINFVAGVSHELRTPLTVIRTAAYNLRNARFRDRPEQVERYGRMIEAESGKLEGMVEQVLQFASAKAGHVIRDRQPVALTDLIEEELRSSRAALEGASVVLEEEIGSSLPVTLADGRALRHALQNLVDNALKYGTRGANWIGVYAEAIIDEQGAATQIRVADHGPGIPPDEQRRIFDPFFRGRRAVEDQVHGTGLGLNLVKSIVEAHGGSISVASEPAKGTEFTIRLPAAPAEFQHAFAHSAD